MLKYNLYKTAQKYNIILIRQRYKSKLVHISVSKSDWTGQGGDYSNIKFLIFMKNGCTMSDKIPWSLDMIWSRAKHYPYQIRPRDKFSLFV